MSSEWTTAVISALSVHKLDSKRFLCADASTTSVTDEASCAAAQASAMIDVAAVTKPQMASGWPSSQLVAIPQWIAEAFPFHVTCVEPLAFDIAVILKLLSCQIAC